ncbi:MFS transporter [Streptomyces sp. DW26H14]|uniref:MFS transporter n=1 Tax=Streptomyces sp. DW26H14 TaxID=3435395 RepID=UPI00403E32B6
MSATTSPTGRTTAVVATLAFAGTVASLNQTLVTPLLAELPRLLHTDSSNSAWVITVTLLVSAVSVPVAGRLGDQLGKRRVMLVCTVPLLLGSVVCALSSSIAPMILGRGLQGLGSGILPLGIALLRDVVPKERLSPSISLVSASMGIGASLGLPLSAAVAQYVSWRYLFWGSAVLALGIALLLWRLVPAVPAVFGGQRFDVPGTVGLAAGLVALLLAVSKGADWGWTSATVLGLFAAAVVVLPAWGWWELRTRDPLIDLRTTARPRVLITNTASVFVGFAMYANSLIMPQLLQLPRATGYGLGQTLLESGLWMAPGGLMMMLVSPLGGRLINAVGAKSTLVAGVLVIACGYGLSMALMQSAWGIAVVIIVINSGVALAYGSMPALILSSVPLSETAAANGFNTLMRSLGTSIGSAVIGAVLANMVTTGHGVAFTSRSGFRAGLLIGCGVALLAAVIAAAIPALRRPADDNEADPRQERSEAAV